MKCKNLWLVLLVLSGLPLVTNCGVDQEKYNAQVRKADSLAYVCNNLAEANAAMRTELEGYKYSPAKLLAAIREDCAAKDFSMLKKNLELLRLYHPDASEYVTAKDIYEQGLRDLKVAQKKAEAEAAKKEAERLAKMKPIERIMKEYSCDEETATLIHHRHIRIGMTDEQCRAAWGCPKSINRTVGSWGVQEQWCYDGTYLYMENGILTSYQD